MMVPTLIITGPVGVGKTSTAMELSIVLEEEGIAHTVIDLDALTMTFPRPPDDRFGERLALTNLADVWRNSHIAGAKNLVVARVIEQPAQVQGIQEAVPGSRTTVARLTAGNEDLRVRVRNREIGSAISWHEERSLRLSRTLEEVPADVVVDTTGRGIRDVAASLRQVVPWAT